MDLDIGRAAYRQPRGRTAKVVRQSSYGVRSAPGTPDDGAEPDAARPPAEPRAAVLVRARAGERRKGAAAAYRAAQQEGRDPIQAVMHATGRNRRRALRLIAGARDAGLLTPRHNKR